MGLGASADERAIETAFEAHLSSGCIQCTINQMKLDAALEKMPAPKRFIRSLPVAMQFYRAAAAGRPNEARNILFRCVNPSGRTGADTPAPYIGAEHYLCASSTPSELAQYTTGETSRRRFVEAILVPQLIAIIDECCASRCRQHRHTTIAVLSDVRLAVCAFTAMLLYKARQTKPLNPQQLCVTRDIHHAYTTTLELLFARLHGSELHSVYHDLAKQYVCAIASNKRPFPFYVYIMWMFQHRYTQANHFSTDQRAIDVCIDCYLFRDHMDSYCDKMAFRSGRAMLRSGTLPANAYQCLSKIIPLVLSERLCRIFILIVIMNDDTYLARLPSDLMRMLLVPFMEASCTDASGDTWRPPVPPRRWDERYATLDM